MTDTTARKTYTATVHPWEKCAYPVEIEGEGIPTQTLTLRQAEAMIRDYISTLHDLPKDSFDVEIRVVTEAKKREATAAQRHREEGSTVQIHFPAEAPFEVFQAFVDRTCEDAYGIERETWDPIATHGPGDRTHDLGEC